MGAKKSSQKFTHRSEQINALLAMDQITPDKFNALNNRQQDTLLKYANDIINTLTGKDRDDFIHKLDLIAAPETKNSIWEYNHNRVTAVISKLMQEYGRMPSKTEIAAETGLSRQTVHKHLNEYENNPLHQEQQKQFRFMANKVLAKVFSFAINGDTAAAKLYLQAVGSLNNDRAPGTITQNNFIQINSITLNQDTLKRISPERLNEIEQILKSALDQPIITKGTDSN
jgi:DNA-binding transcriptional regulator YhcF (GntR family)